MIPAFVGSNPTSPVQKNITWWVWRSWLARQIVALEAVGSNPTIHPGRELSEFEPQAMNELSRSRVDALSETESSLEIDLAENLANPSRRR